MLFPRLVALFIIVPVVEIILFMVLGRYVGIPGTLVLIITTALIGASLAQSQGLRTLERFQQRIGSGQIPGGEIIAGLLILVAGLLLLTPGFLTDAVGFSLLIPPVRGALGKALLAYYTTKYSTKAQWDTSGAARPRRFPHAGKGTQTSVPGRGKVIDVETTETIPPPKD